MRIMIIVALVALAGCAEPAPPLVETPDGDPPVNDPNEPVQMHLLGNQTNGTADATVLAANCGTTNNVWAYTLPLDPADQVIDPDDFWQEDLVTFVSLYSPLPTPEAHRFSIAVFQETPQGLVLAPSLHGGSGTTIHADHAGTLDEWQHDQLPQTVDIKVPDGQDNVHIAIACEGTPAAVNYIVSMGGLGGEHTMHTSAPDYIEGAVATGFDHILAYGTEELNLGFMSWSTSGNVETTYNQAVPAGARIGETIIDWSSPTSGWTQLHCGHLGFSEHGIWKYDANLHAGDVYFDGFVMQDPLTIYVWIAEIIAFGTAQFWHTDEGYDPGRFTFEVEHEASAQALSTTYCEGLHLGSTLGDLFGVAAARAMDPDNGVVQPETIGGWPLDD